MPRPQLRPLRSRSRRRPGFAGRPAFTLVELIVAVGVIALLLGIVTVVAASARKSAGATRELALARSLMAAYSGYSVDNRGSLLPGFYNVTPALPTPSDGKGNTISGPAAHRYPWRLAPFLDYNLDALIQDRWLLDDLRYTNQFEYFVSLYPSLGLNTTFLGGDSSSEGLGFSPAFASLYGNFYLRRMSEARRPAELITFASARTNAPYEPGAPPIIEGYFKVESPFLLNRRWAESWDPEQLPKQWGFLSMRHPGRKAAVGFLDGHTGLLDDGAVTDMRRWADRADRPDWTLVPSVP
ncbi:MAG TPA: type II secretion system protein [Phycisphaerales bacterium]|nr:type II secretion system protein [Phycisphaerales bacterium]HMP38048.1 type II secretion system protein [Phycisphaerales bacterium]